MRYLIMHGRVADRKYLPARFDSLTAHQIVDKLNLNRLRREDKEIVCDCEDYWVFAFDETIFTDNQNV